MLARALSWCDDALNPILVKELRQAVRGRFIVGIFHLFLVVQFIIVAVFLMSQGARMSVGAMRWHAGRELFMSLHVVLLGTCLGLIPLYVFVRMVLERTGDNLDLVSISTLKPWRYVCGKIQGGVGLCMIIHAACLPFIFVTYLFRGVDLPSVLVLIGLEMTIFIVVLLGVIFLASMPCSRLFRVLLGLVLVGGLCFVVGFAGALSWELMREGIGSMLGQWDFWRAALSYLMVMTAIGGLFYALSVGMISPPAANRSLPIRIYFTVAWMLTAAGALMTSDREVMLSWLVFWCIVLSLGVMVAASEREEPSGRIRAQIPRLHSLRALALVFYSGAAGGVIWCLLMAIATPLVAALGVELATGHSYWGQESMAIWGFTVMMAYAFGYSMLAVLVRAPFRGRIKHQYTWVIAMFIAAVMLLVPLLIGFFFTDDRYHYLYDGSLWMVGNPILMTLDDEYFFPCALMAATIFALGLVFNWRWFWRQFRVFRPMDAS